MQEHLCDNGRCSLSTGVQSEGGRREQSPNSKRHSQKYFVSGCRTESSINTSEELNGTHTTWMNPRNTSASFCLLSWPSTAHSQGDPFISLQALKSETVLVLFLSFKLFCHRIKSYQTKLYLYSTFKSFLRCSTKCFTMLNKKKKVQLIQKTKNLTHLLIQHNYQRQAN